LNQAKSKMKWPPLREERRGGRGEFSQPKKQMTDSRMAQPGSLLMEKRGSKARRTRILKGGGIVCTEKGDKKICGLWAPDGPPPRKGKFKKRK